MKKVILFIIIIICVFGGIGYGVYKTIPKKEEPKTVVKKSTNEIEGYGYTLDNLDTELYKTEFETLKENLTGKDVDLKEYAKSVAKLFVIDLYTINNKVNKYDVGGIEFIMKDNKDNFITNVTDTIYKYVEDNTDNKRNQNLPEVKSVKINDVKEEKFLIKEDKKDKKSTKGKKYDAYRISMDIEYVTDYGYDEKAEIIVINDDGIMYVVEKN